MLRRTGIALIAMLAVLSCTAAAHSSARGSGSSSATSFEPESSTGSQGVPSVTIAQNSPASPRPVETAKSDGSGWIGVSIQDLDQDKARQLGGANSFGALVSAVNPAGPAARAGIEAGDIILRLDQRPINKAQELATAVRGAPLGATMQVTLLRAKQVQLKLVTISQAPASDVPPPSDGATQTDAAASAREEIVQWSRIRESSNPADFESFLAVYPNGRLTSIARDRLGLLRPDSPALSEKKSGESKEQRAKDTEPARRAGLSQIAPPLTTTLIAEVQDRLYNLTYNPGPINGRMSEATVGAVTAYQQSNRLDVTGTMNEQFLAALRAATVPTVWAAIAFNGQSGYSSAWLKSSRREAEQIVAQQCERGRLACKLAIASGSQCIALSSSEGRTRRRRLTGAYVSVNGNLNEARGAALDYCRRESDFADSCAIKVNICADGSHTR